MGRTSALAATVACGFALIFSASASADLRTAWEANKYPEEGQSSPTTPKLRDAQLRLDTATGQLDVTINFEEPLADPAVTSALRPWRAEVVLGDWMKGGSCLGNDDSWLRLDAALGDDEPGLIDRWGDYQDQFDALEVTKAFAADRTGLTLSVTAPALTAQTLICASIEIRDSRDDGEIERDFSSTFGFVFDGFSPTDGAIEREATADLRQQADWLNSRWAPRRARNSMSPRYLGCRQRYSTRLTCKIKARMPDIAGQPTLTLRGDVELNLPGTRYSTSSKPLWLWSMRGSLSYRRCPKTRKVPRKLRGEPCHYPVRWSGGKDLSEARFGP